MCPTYKNLTFHLDPKAPMFKKMFVNHGTVDDLTSPGKFYLAVVGQPEDAKLIGYLYTDYTIRLAVPRASPETLWNTRCQIGKCHTTWTAMKSGGTSAPFYFGGWPLAVVQKVDNNLHVWLTTEGNFDVSLVIQSTNDSHGGTLAVVTGPADTTGYFEWTSGGAWYGYAKKTQGAGQGSVWYIDTHVKVLRGDPHPEDSGRQSHVEYQFSNTTDGGQITMEIRISAVENTQVNALVPTLGSSTLSPMARLEAKIAALEMKALRSLGSKDEACYPYARAAPSPVSTNGEEQDVSTSSSSAARSSSNKNRIMQMQKFGQSS